MLVDMFMLCSVSFGLRSDVGGKVPVSFGLWSDIGDKVPVSFGHRSDVGGKVPVSFGLRSDVGDKVPVSFGLRSDVGDKVPVSFGLRSDVGGKAPVSPDFDWGSSLSFVLTVSVLVSGKKRHNPVSSAASVGLDKNWKNEVKSDINSLNKNFDLLLSSLGKEKGVFGQKICLSCGDSGHIADECMRSQEEISQVHGYGQFQNSPRSFNRNYNQGGNYNNNGNFNNNNCQGNYQNQNQPKQFQQSNFNQGGRSKKEEADGNKLDKIMEFITKTYQNTDTNSKSIATIENQIAQMAEQIGKREDGKFPSTTTVNPSHTQRPGKEHQVNEVITLRSGKKVDNKVSAPTLDNDSDTKVIFDEKEEFEKGFKSEKQKVVNGKDDSKVGEHGVEVNTAPYPSALEKPAFFPFGK
uniref:CCHC-type domain-containing protein n=1 Tax=Lactuca sativa TaxID=4236 RepID=A0A9R1X212_LACSA|nr:hypothetical protein LSAT_V11C700375100 [Lactuca sativa]